MEAALLSGFIKIILPKLLSMADDKYKLRKSLKDNVIFLEKELRIIVIAIDAELSSHPREAARVAVDELRKLAHDIEDCIERISYRVTREQQSSAISRTLRSATKVHTDLQVSQELRKLRKLVEEAKQRRDRYTVPGQPQPPPSSAAYVEEGSSSTFVPSDPRLLEADLVGVEAPLAELEAQLEEGRPEQLKVVSIVGFCGLGKTALAGELYRRATGSGSRFEKHAWVCATHKGPREVLMEMLRKLVASSSHGSVLLDTSDIGIAQLGVDVKLHLENKRYFIVIDDIRSEDNWKIIKSAFPADSNLSSRIVVTTTVQSVANACSSGDGYVHRIARLDENCSNILFSKKACPQKHSGYKQPDSSAILKKCDGQPLALVTVGEFLQTNGWPIGPKCQDLCRKLPYHLKNHKKFGNMRRVLIHNYNSLPGHALKACLLYFGMFPIDHPIRRKYLLRRWLAEGFVGTDPSPNSAFDELMDQNIIQPINLRNDDNVKSCQTYAMMHEIILHMCISQNFITLFCDDKIEPKYVRRLSVHPHIAKCSDSFDSIDLSLLRSLIITGVAGETLLDFSKYQLLRVLDLEKCDDLTDYHVNGIYNLLLLKYLSLGKNVTKLTSDIAKLENLETIHARRTEGGMVLPEEVFLLPCLTHLLGKFKLPDKIKRKTKVQEFLSKGKSNLQTLSGFITDGSEGFLHHLMGYMNKLTKVKIFLKSSSWVVWTDLKRAVQQFIHDDKEANIGSRSLSLHFGYGFEDFLTSLEGPCYLTSLKLHGSLPCLPRFVLSLQDLIELSIQSTKLTASVLDALSNLRNLKYLKLIADELEKFVIKQDAFRFLLRFCLVLKRPTFPVIQEGALQYLVKLQLLCKDMDGLSDIQIKCLRHLEEVTLDLGITGTTKTKWEHAAKEHPNRPKVLLLKSVNTTEDESRGNSIALQGPVRGRSNIQMQVNKDLGPYSVRMEQNNHAVQSILHDQPNSDLNIMGHSDVSHALNELSNCMVTSST